MKVRSGDATGSDDRTHRRDLRDLVWLGVGAAVLVLSALPVSEDGISGAERAVFRGLNDVSGIPFAPVWLLMQLGNIAVVPISALVALVTRRPWLAAMLALAGLLTWLAAKVVKQFVTRGRPSEILADVHIRGAAAEGLGFVSGHAAVAVALAFVALPWLGRRARWVVIGLAAFVCVARVWVGVHLPLDVVGGAGLGLLVGGAVRLLFGRRALAEA
jgi:undecaprenyl-diphosphatase